MQKLDRQITGQSMGAQLFVTMKGEKEQRYKTVVFDESNVMGAKIDKLTSMLGNLYSELTVQAIQIKSISR